jgi:hypothetical protein
MVIKHTGAAYQYEGMTFAIGQRIYANGQSDWEGLFGVITEIRTDGDKETENETADIYCSFDVPVLPADVTELEERFSSLYQEPKTIEDISLDEVIMAPEMIEPLEPWTGREKKNVSAVVEEYTKEKPICYQPETDTAYPLCIGNGEKECENCNLFVDFGEGDDANDK